MRPKTWLSQRIQPALPVLPRSYPHKPNGLTTMPPGPYSSNLRAVIAAMEAAEDWRQPCCDA